MIARARAAAYGALRAITMQQETLPVALARARDALPDERDRALATELVTGVLRWQAQLDGIIEHAARRAVDRLDPEVRDVLRLGVYQLVHLERIPAAAAVTESVELTRRAGKSSASGLVNAVLRTVARRGAHLPLPERPQDTDPAMDGARREAALKYLSVSLSHPRWLARRWLDRLGLEEAEAWERFNNVAPPLTLRVNRLRTDPQRLSDELAREGVIVTPARFAPDGLVVSSGNPLRSSLARQGQFVVQNEASQLVALLGRCQPGQRVLDCCASPGGKTTAMAAMMGDDGLIAAADVRPARIRLLSAAVAASGTRCVRILQADLRKGLPFNASFDLVFVDAPCSGLGTIRRDPDIRWRRREEDLAAFAVAQHEMLKHAAEAVRPQGRLVYATCSSEPDENEDVVSAFLQDHPSFRRVDLRERPERVALAAVLDGEGFLRTSPSEHQLEAFFGATLVRER